MYAHQTYLHGSGNLSPPFPGAAAHQTPPAPFVAAWDGQRAAPRAAGGYTPEPTIKVRGVQSPQGKRIVVTAVAAAVTISLAFVVFALLSRSAPPPPADVTPGRATAPAAGSGDAGTALAAAAPADVAPPAVEAPVVAPLTIADAVQHADWAAALRICAGARPGKLSVDERASCGIAACNAKQRKTAASYYAFASASGQLAIERACRAQSISLLPPQVPKSGCSDPKYRRQNPLRCKR
jgi:hypothetical protein